MKRVMIVEDEKLVLWGITSLFEKHDQYAIVGSFSNPLEALDEIRKQRPDLVITDIRMPQMDGITLIKQVKDFDPQIHIIVLSCYDDFEIVHNAFKLGIDDYILKHELEEDRLFSILKGLDAAGEAGSGVSAGSWVSAGAAALLDEADPAAEASAEKTTLTSDEEVNEEVDEASEDFQQYLEGHFLEGNIQREKGEKGEKKRRSAEASDFSSQNIILLKFVFKKNYTRNFEPIPSGINTMFCMKLIQNTLQRLQLGKIFLFDGDIVSLIEGDEVFTEKRKIFFHEVMQQLKTYINHTICILRGKPVPAAALGEQWKLFQASESVVFYVRDSRIISLQEKELHTGREHLDLPDPLILTSFASFEGKEANQANNQIHQPKKDQPKDHTEDQTKDQTKDQGDSDEWKRRILQVFDTAREKRTQASILSMDLLLFWHNANRLIRQLFDVAEGEDSMFDAELNGNTLYTLLTSFDDFEMLRSWYVSLLEKLRGQIQQVYGHRRSIIRIKLYLHQHYKDRISLASLSKTFNLNGNYLCDIFKKDTGKGYVEYLNSIRISHAKEMLIKTDLTAESICEEVGFVNASHFSKVFKKITGYTITEFRELRKASKASS